MSNDHATTSWPFQRVSKLLSGVLFVTGVGLLVFWTTKWIRGDPDQYPDQILAGLTLAAVLTVITASKFVRSPFLQWLMLGVTYVLLGSLFWLIASW